MDLNKQETSKQSGTAKSKPIQAQSSENIGMPDMWKEKGGLIEMKKPDYELRFCKKCDQMTNWERNLIEKLTNEETLLWARNELAEVCSDHEFLWKKIKKENVDLEMRFSKLDKMRNEQVIRIINLIIKKVLLPSFPSPQRLQARTAPQRPNHIKKSINWCPEKNSITGQQCKYVAGHEGSHSCMPDVSTPAMDMLTVRAWNDWMQQHACNKVPICYACGTECMGPATSLFREKRFYHEKCYGGKQ